jgi:hypothetical protein
MSTIHLSSKHKILKPGTPVPLSAPRASSDITSFLSKPIMSVDERLEENILHWMVAESEPFTTVESQSFQPIFRDLPGTKLPIKSASTVNRRILSRFKESRENIMLELDNLSCITIGLSLDIWTSKNHLSILGIGGHSFISNVFWSSKRYRALIAERTWQWLSSISSTNSNSAPQLLTITGDNVSNNDVMISEL